MKNFNDRHIEPFVRPYHYYNQPLHYPGQRGEGLGNLLRAPLRFGLPLLKQAFKFVGPIFKRTVKKVKPQLRREFRKIKPLAIQQARQLGKSIASDVIGRGKPLRRTLKRRIPTTIENLVDSYTLPKNRSRNKQRKRKRIIIIKRRQPPDIFSK